MPRRRFHPRRPPRVAGGAQRAPNDPGPKILLPPGIGDSHWVVLKLEDLIRKELDGVKPYVYSWNPNKKNWRGREYFQRIPFVKWGDYWEGAGHREIHLDMVANTQKTWLRDWQGFDHVLAFNRKLEDGVPLKDILPQFEPNWDYQLDVTPDEREMANRERSRGPYIMVYWKTDGYFTKWMQYFDPLKFIKAVHAQFPDHRLVVTGREWDAPTFRKFPFNRYPYVESWVSKTDLGQLFALFRGSDGYIGFQAGQGMIAQHMCVPTMLYWHPFDGRDNFFHKSMWTSYIAPHRFGVTSDVTDLEAYKLEESVERFHGMVESAPGREHRQRLQSG